MPAYWVARSRIVDPAEYKKYTDRIPAIFAKYGGRVLARGGRFQIMEGPDKFHRFVVVESETADAAVACLQSPASDRTDESTHSREKHVKELVVESRAATPPESG